MDIIKMLESLQEIRFLMDIDLPKAKQKLTNLKKDIENEIRLKLGII